MESLYRKYRPQTFADVVGQTHVVSTLERAVLEGRTSHAYLFCGPRGTGKTTMARLLAKALMCEQGAGHLPDGTCEQCRLIAAGEHPDVYELDAASRTGVENVREEIINRVGYAPVQAPCKMYIIDEVHMLTTQAFNALLKTLEEPPDHVIFVLCTTDPQKIPATILSRVQRFDFRPISSEDILGRLEYVCEQEGFTYEQDALQLVVTCARGGMRDALSTLEQLSVFGGGTISLDAARDLLGAVPGSEIDRVMDALAKRDVPTLFSLVAELVDEGRDLLQFTRELSGRVRDVYVVAVVGGNPSVLASATDPDALVAESRAFGSTERLARALTLLGEASREMGSTPNQRLVLEICFARMAHPESDLTIEALAERIATLEQRICELERGGVVVTQVAAPQAERPAPAPVPAPVPAPARVVEERPAPAAQPKPASQAAPARPQQQPSDSKGNAAPQESRPAPAQQAQPRQPRPAQQALEPQTAVEPKPQPQPAPEPTQEQAAGSTPSGGVADKGALQRMWKQVVQTMLKKFPPRGSLLSSAVIESDDGETLTVALPKGSGFALKMLERRDVSRLVEGVVKEVFGPRTMKYHEGTGIDLTVNVGSRKEPAPAPAPVSAPAPEPARPAPAPTPHPAEPQPVFSAPKQPAPEPKDAYPMPWDEPTGAQEPPYVDDDVVPYDEVGMPFVADEDDYGMAGAVSAPMDEAPKTSRPMPWDEPQVAASAAKPVSEAAPAFESKGAAEPAAAADKAPQMPVFGEKAAEAAPEAPVADDVPYGAPMVDDLPPELVSILENAFEVFGSDVTVTKGDK